MHGMYCAVYMLGLVKEHWRWHHGHVRQLLVARVEWQHNQRQDWTLVQIRKGRSWKHRGSNILHEIDAKSWWPDSSISEEGTCLSLREPERGQISVKKWSEVRTHKEGAHWWHDWRPTYGIDALCVAFLPSSPLLFNKKEYINITRYIQSLKQSGVLMIIQMQASKRERSSRKEKFR
jgi:hypothetical protein